jgi:hypothetical protein
MQAQPLRPDEQNQGERNADQSAVKAHPAVPDLEDLQRIGGEGLSLRGQRQHVEDHIAQPPAHDHAHREPDDQVVELDDGGRRRASTPQPCVANQAYRIAPPQENSGDVGQGVPANGERPQGQAPEVQGGHGEYLRVDIREQESHDSS